MIRLAATLIAVAAVALAGSSRLEAQQQPAATEVATPTVPAEVEQRRAPRRSWTADRRDLSVGDIVTVLVDEHTLASANKSTNAVDRRRRDAGLGFQVRSPTSSTGTNIGVSTNNDGESRQSGAATRQNRFTSEISVRVTEVMPNGLLKIEGRKLVNVDKAQQEVTLTGWIRPEDVSATNLVDSWRIANAEIVYVDKGPLGKPAGGMLGRMIGRMWP